MTKLRVVNRVGKAADLEARDGLSVMNALRGAGYEVQAVCGGCCSCATCHVYIDGRISLPAMSRDENDLLDGSDHRRPNSRLSCQLQVTPAFAGLLVTIAPEE